MRFFSPIELVNLLETEKAGGKPGQLANRLVYADLVILESDCFYWCPGPDLNRDGLSAGGF